MEAPRERVFSEGWQNWRYGELAIGRTGVPPALTRVAGGLYWMKP